MSKPFSWDIWCQIPNQPCQKERIPWNALVQDTESCKKGFFWGTSVQDLVIFTNKKHGFVWLETNYLEEEPSFELDLG